MNDQDRHEVEVDAEQMEIERRDYERNAEQDALPPHKRQGYAESMYEQADMRRKEIRENGK